MFQKEEEDMKHCVADLGEDRDIHYHQGCSGKQKDMFRSFRKEEVMTS
jgi:hypothetical protein